MSARQTDFEEIREEADSFRVKSLAAKAKTQAFPMQKTQQKLRQMPQCKFQMNVRMEVVIENNPALRDFLLFDVLKLFALICVFVL